MKHLVILLSLFACFWRCKNETAHSVNAAGNENPLDSTAVEAEEIREFKGFLKTYTGTIDGKHAINLVLTNWGDGFVSGYYAYQKSGKRIELSGEMLDSNRFQLIEMVNGKETGVFSGVLGNPSRIGGFWSDAAKRKKLPFEILETEPATDSIGWAGNWHLNEVWDGGTLLIGNVKPSSFDFALTIVRSSHNGTIEGTAKRQGKRAEFKLKDFEDEPCYLTFERQGDLLLVDQKSSSFACGFGARAYATGQYERKWVVKKATLKVGAGDDAVFPDKATHDAFKTFIGSALYEEFAFNMQYLEKEPPNPKDDVQATMVKGAVAGLHSLNEAIILYDQQGKFWAATIGLAGDELPVVNYFSNDETWKNKLPAAIEAWREGFKEYQVVFH